MKKIAAIALVLIIGCTGSINQEIYSDHEQETILLGEINWEGLTKPSYVEWFNPNYLNYQVDAASLEAVATEVSDIRVVMFMGTWCEDSQLQVPQFYKILDDINFDINKMTVFAIDRSDDGLVVPEKYSEYGIVNVPTFIFYRSEKEIGRITEYPIKTLEKDMGDIIGG